jgi:iron complex transport system ATP-binding protein
MDKRQIHTDGLSTGFHPGGNNERVLQQGLNLRLVQGELVCLLGLNGTGKSTLLRTLLGYQKPIAGEVHIMGQKLSELSIKDIARRVAVVLTDRIEDPFLTAFEVALTGRYPYGMMISSITAEDRRIVGDTFQRLSVSHLSDAVFQKLSDGEKQRVLIVRAIAQETPFIFMDEPVAYIDSPGKIMIMHLVRELADTYQKGVIMATHDVESAFHFADRLWLLGKNKAFEEGNPQKLARSGSLNRFFDRGDIVFDKETIRFRKKDLKS